MRDIDPAYVGAGGAIAGSITGQILSWKATVTFQRAVGLFVASALTGIFAGPAFCKLLGISRPDCPRRPSTSRPDYAAVALAVAIMQIAETASPEELACQVDRDTADAPYSSKRKRVIMLLLDNQRRSNLARMKPAGPNAKAHAPFVIDNEDGTYEVGFLDNGGSTL